MTENEDFFDDRAAASDDEGPGFDLRELVLYSIGRARWMILFCGGLGLLGGLALGFSQPNIYGSLAKMFFVPGSKETHRVEDMVNGEMDATMIQTGIADEMKLIENPRVHRRVAERIGPRRLLSPPDPSATDSPTSTSIMARIHRLQKWWFGKNAYVESDRFDPKKESTIEAAAKRARASLTLYNPPRTNYIDFVILTTDAKLAQDMCQAYIEESQVWHEEFYSTEARVNLVAKELEKEVNRTEEKRKAYREHIADCGNDDVTVQLEQLHGTIANLKESVATTTIEIEGLGKDDEILGEQLLATPKTKTILIPAVKVPNPEYSRISKKVIDLYEELEELERVSQPQSEKFRKEHPRILGEIESAGVVLSGLDTHLIEEIARQEEEESPRYVELLNERADTDRSRQRKITELARMEDNLEGAQADLENVRACTGMHDHLQDEIGLAKDSMLRVRLHYDSIDKESKRERDEQLQSLRTVQAADFEPLKKAPSRLKMFFGGVIGGLALGVFLAIARQLLDGSARYPRGLATKLGIPLVGVVTELPAWRRKTRSL